MYPKGDVATVIHLLLNLIRCYDLRPFLSTTVCMDCLAETYFSHIYLVVFNKSITLLEIDTGQSL